MRRICTALAVALAAVGAGAALAITNGGPDGDGHPMVGALLAQQAYSDGTWEYCSGTLIAPRVFLTAAHCNEGVPTVRVTFDSVFEADGGTTYTGTFVPDPLFNQTQSDPHDLAVVLLDKAPKGITPARLPALDAVDALKVGDPITAVGYGAQAVLQGPGGKTFQYADVRYLTTGSVNSVTPSWLRASMNPATGDGGTCYGDSGGPNFIGDSLVIGGITITGDTYCRATNVDYRVDTPSARAFLGQYVTLP